MKECNDLPGGKPSIDILLATYNGGHFVEAQLASLVRQTERGWRLVVSDDCSADDTLVTAKRFCAENDIPAIFLESPASNLGVNRNFARLLAYSAAPYFFLCDQDDIWHPDKVSVFHRTMQEHEARYGHDKPLIIHSDMRVVDEKGREVAASFWEYQRLRPGGKTGFPSLLVQNRITGCAVMGNRALSQRIRQVPDEAIMYDWWLALLASGCGNVHAIDERLSDYRLHPGNVEGPKDFGWSARFRNRQPLAYYRTRIERVRCQAEAFYRIHGMEIDKNWSPFLTEFLTLPERSFLKKRWSIIRHGFWMSSFLRNLVYLAIV